MLMMAKQLVSYAKLVYGQKQDLTCGSIPTSATKNANRKFALGVQGVTEYPAQMVHSLS